MAKQLNVDLRFTANNTQAKQQIQDLQTALDKLITTSGKSSSGLGITKDIAQATSEVAKLQAMLESSKNASGGLDLGKFNQSLAQGQVKISDYAKTLSSLGPQGDQAFAKLAKAIINAEVPLKRTNSLLKEFKTSLANTARWQLSSSMLHGFMGAVQSAYGYAQDLNESLNNIRIVTGQNIEQMATFAKEANKAAQALSTTTTEYTDASLIYYQQGLSDSEVAKRTEVTIKMANAAGQSAQIVSDQLTAVWNNFYDGSKSLEYYADVMTALGAATASSTDEIAGGLEKFAAIGETIGLSYEYAASALATITSNTRQSEEVVGTALKTIFARIQGLNLGETLDDGTSLNKYSAALEKVGISIFEQNGEIKKMDNILDEMAAKWGTLAKDQQIALAQTVAGVRQYTQLIALMDNWDVGDSDSMVANLDTAYNATGALQEQADIYAESWEAARDRVTAAAEEIYNQLLNDEFFIDLNNGFAGFLNIVSNTIDTLGGLPGVLTVASSIMFKMFGKDMAQAIDDWGYNIKLRSKEGVQSLIELREQAKESLKTMYADNVDTGPVNSASQVAFNEYASLTDVVLAKQKELTAQGQMLSAENQKQVQYLLQTNEAYGEQAILSAKSLEAAEQQTRQAEMQLRYAVQKQNQNIKDPANKVDFKTTLKPQIDEAQKAQMQYSSLYDVYLKLKKLQNKGLDSATVIQELGEMSKQAKAAGVDISHFDTVLKSLNSGDSIVVTLNAIESNLDDLALEALNTAETVKNSLTGMGIDGTQVDAILDQLIESWRQQGIVTADLAEKLKNIKVNGDAATEAINKMQGPPPTVGQKFMAVANTISNIAMSISAVKGLIDTWNNDDMSFGEKLLSTFTTLGMVIPMVTTALTGNNLALLGSASSSIVAALGFKGVDIAAKMAAGGVGALWAALWPIALIMAAVTAAIWLGVEAWQTWKASTPEGQLEAAEEEAKALKNALDEAKNAAQELESAFNSYDNAVEALENCTKGTQEWNNALQEVNNQVLELINKYPSLAKYIEYGEHGELTIGEEGRQELENLSNQRITAAQGASINANQKVREFQLAVDTKDLRNEILSATTDLEVTNANGADVGGIVRSFLVNNAKLFARQTKSDQIETLEKYFEDKNFTGDAEIWIAAIQDLMPEFGKLASSIDANTSATKAENQAIAASTLAANERVQGSDYASEVIATSGEVLAQTKQEILDDLKSSRWGKKGIAQWDGANKEAKDVWNRYLAAAGLDASKNYLVDTTGNDNNRKFIYGEDKKEITLDAMMQIVAAGEAAQKLGTSAEGLIGVFSDLSTSGNEADKALASIIAYEDLSDASQGQAEDLKNEVETDGTEGISQEEALKYITDKYGADYDFTQFGYESAEAMAQAIANSINNIDEEWSSVGENLKSSAKQAFEKAMSDGVFNEFSLDEAKQAADMYKKALEQGGTEATQILDSIFRNSGKDADKLSNILSGIDWQTTNVFELSKILEEAGIETDGFIGELAKLIGLMKEGQNTGFEVAAEHYTNMKDMAKLKEGDSITEEQYKQLEAAGIDASQYFKLMGDGSYELKEAAEEFYQLVNEKSLDVFKSNIEAIYQEVGSVDGVMRRRNEDTIADNNIGTSGGYNQELVSDQLTFLEALNIQLEDLDTYQQIVAEGGTMTREALQEIQTLVEENKGRWDELPASIQASAAELEKHQQALANSASTVDELNRLYAEQFITLEQYQEAVDEVMENEFEMEGLDPDAAEEVADAFRDMAEAGVEGMEALKNDEEAVKDATVRYMELNEAIEDIYDNYKDYTQVLKDVRNATSKADRAMAANSDTAKKLRVSMAGLLGTTEDMIDADFLATIDPKDFEAAANGNVDAIERIRHQFIQLKAEMYDIDFASLKSELDAFNNGAYIDLNTTPFLNALIQAAVNAGQTAAEIEAMLSGFGIDADVTPFTEELWQATQQAQAAGQDIANATSFTTEVEQEQVENPRTVENPKFDESVVVTHRYGWNQVTMNGGFGYISYPSIYAEAHKGVTTSVDTQEFTDTETVKGQTVTNGAGASGKGGVIVKNAHKAPTSSRTPSAGNTSRPPVSSGGGGGGSSKEKEPSKPKKINYTKESDIVERYKEVNDALDNVADSMTRVQMEADILWGKNHINNLKEQNELLEKQIELLDRQYEEAKQYQEKDKVDLGKAASALNVSLVLDSETGDITNIEDAEESIYRQLAAAEEHYNSLATGEEQDAYEETILEPLRQKIKDFETARDLYYDSVETAEDALIAKQEMELQKMANNFEIWSEGLEIEIKFNEDDLELIEAMLSRIEDDIYQMAEAAVLMTGIGGSENGQLGEYLNNLDIYDQKLNELNQKYESGEITEAAYYEGLEEVKTGILDNVASIQELDKTMMTYYGDTLVAAGEELARYTDLIEEQNSVLEYYLELLDLMGESADYKKIGVVLEGQAEIAEEQAKTSREWYEARRVDAENAKAAYEEALAMGVSEEEVALLKEKWLAAEEAAAEAQDKMLSDAEAWAEALRAILENKLSELGQILENALTQGFGSFDAMTTALERANSLQEEYLTTTNQIYETNKLMRTAQQEIDKTSNTVAKRRLKSFIEETQHLQDQTKLSQYELEIQQAKYDLLLAEMALEDAQNAKSTVRLQRDAEGNFGYVYTADQNALSQAEQKLEDAQNRLYNIGLEGANEYAEKYQQTLNEMYDTLNDIQQQYLEGSFETEEEYHKAMADAKAYYYEKLQQYSSLYQVAITTDSRVVRDAWTSDFSSMIYETDKWMDEVTTYVSAVQEAFTAWKNEISGPGGVEELVGNSLGEISKNVDEVTDKSGNLSDTINNEVIPALNEEINAVDELTNQYATMRESIQLVTERHLEQVRSINKATEAYYALERAQNAANNASQSVTLPNYPDNSTSSSNSSSSNSSSSSSHSSNSNSGNNGSYQTTTPNVVKEDKWKATYRLQGKTTTLNNYRSADAARTAAENSINANVNKLTGVTLTEKTDMAASARRSIAVAKYDTGGYTGSWGSYGKLAMLHEKELVLNKEDTENLLTSIEVLDEILKMIDLQSLNAQIGGLLNSPRLQEIQSQVLEQSVKIEAVFPGVSDRNELEEAFNNLINQASQYANRK